MVKEWLLEFYLLIIKVVFSVCGLLPLKFKVAFVVSHSDNAQYVYEEIRKNNVKCEAVFLCKGQNINQFLKYEDTCTLPIDSWNPICFIRCFYHLATSEYILVDDYYDFLAATEFKEEVTCVQLWHTSGEIKRFGHEKKAAKGGRARRHFLTGCSRFNKVVVGSDSMAKYFLHAFHINGENILRTGIPKTDFFYDSALKESVFNRIEQENELLWNKKVILYVPTCRDQDRDKFTLKLELGKMKAMLGDDYIVVLRLPPSIQLKTDYSKLFQGFVVDYSSENYDIKELMVISDYLITDYSSVIYEYALLKKPMIFYANDLETHEVGRGLWTAYKEAVPGPLAKDSDDIINLILADQFDMNRIEEFAEKWNKYSKGKSSENLVYYLFDKSPVYSSKHRAL